MKKYSQVKLAHLFDCSSIVVKGNNFPRNLITLVFFFKQILIDTVTAIIQNTSAYKTVQSVSVLFLKKLPYIWIINIIQLLTFEWINIIRLLPERPCFSLSIQCLFFLFMLKLFSCSQILCHMISDVKLSHYFLLINVINRDAFLTLKSFKKQLKSTTHSLNAGKCFMNTVDYISLQTVFILN